MSKISLTDLVNLQNETTAVNAVNANNAIIEAAFDNTLSRDGTSPNQMNALLDMNRNQIINLPAPGTVNSPARLIDVTSNPTIVVPSTGVSGHNVPYLDGNNTWSGTNTFNNTSTFVSEPVFPVPANSILGNNTGTPTSVQNLTAAQVTAMLNPVTSGTKGVAPASGGGTSNFLRADGTWAIPPGTVSGNLIYVNIKDYGGVGDGVTDNVAAFNSAWAALGTTGGCIFFPAGKYLFSSNISKTLSASGQYAVTLMGAGSTASTLYWPAGGGFTFTAGNVRSTMHIIGLSLTTGAANTGTALNFVGISAAVPTCPWNTIYDVMITGDDFSNYGFSKYWAIGIKWHLWSQWNVVKLNTSGLYGSPQTAGGGIGVQFEGDTGTAAYGILYNFLQCSFNFHVNGAVYGDYIQGATFDQCNFNGRVGGAGILIPGGTLGVLSQLACTNCQFDYGLSSISCASTIDGVNLSNNTFSVSTTGGIAVDLKVVFGNVIGNFFPTLNGAATGTIGLRINTGSVVAISGNAFTGVATGILLNSGSSNCKVLNNVYNGVTTQVTNSGSGNIVGTASA